jgi:peptide-methionine (S)-S-oxide reductase
MTGVNRNVKEATFAAGCFWGIEEAFRKVKGVIDVTVGYTGGSLDNPTYQDVCSGTTGHAEAVLLEYDASQVSYEDLLEVFWTCHDPTTPNRQGPDEGAQYRSAIFFHDADQETAARASKNEIERRGRHDRPIVTEITSASTFWPAEAYHQRHFEKQDHGRR